MKFYMSRKNSTNPYAWNRIVHNNVSCHAFKRLNNPIEFNNLDDLENVHGAGLNHRKWVMCIWCRDQITSKAIVRCCISVRIEELSYFLDKIKKSEEYADNFWLKDIVVESVVMPDA